MNENTAEGVRAEVIMRGNNNYTGRKKQSDMIH